jgi:2-polyprenyl-6-methoxyphenol hydroxylase-like FAD-dependent oxidoreductase
MRSERAVVLGAGMGGLLAAAALSEAYTEITIVDRDVLPDGDAPRRAVPQGRHAHALLPAGHLCMEELLPGLTGELLARGAVPYRALTQLRFQLGGHWLARGDAGRDSVTASRPLIEACVRRRVLALANVTLLDRCDALGLLGGDRVTGVRVLRQAPGSAVEDLDADLVVAATGRSARLGSWLEALGYDRPAEERLDVDLRYASVHMRLPEDAVGGDRLVLVGAHAGQPRSLAFFAQEKGRWILTAGGYAGEGPPGDLAGLLEYTATFAPPDVVAAVRAAEPVSDVATFRFPANLRRRYERTRLPEGLVPLGDAICAFNPIYGQGMTVAALEAVALRDALGHRNLQRRYLRAAAKVVDRAWGLAAGADLAQPSVTGPRPRGYRLVSAYLRRLHAAAEHDEALAVAFIHVSGMLDRPGALLRPGVVWRVLAPRVRTWSARTAASAGRAAPQG